MSLIPSPREFRDRFDNDEALEAELPDRPIASLRDIQYLYGRLYTLATTGKGEYAAYLTPQQAGDLLDEPESLIAVRIDLSDGPKGDPRLAEEPTTEPVSVTSYKQKHVEQVAHCWFNSARGIDHSVTHRTGQNKEPEKVTGYLIERLTRWASDDVVQSVADEHEDGWIIEKLAALDEREDTAERILESVENQLEDTTTALTTVKVKLTPEGEYRYPGDLDTDVFQAAMRARKLSKLVSKGAASESAGQAVDLLTGVETRTVGTAEDPLNYFLGKQLEKFPGFDPDEAWRTHPISEDAAVTLMNASPFVDACTYRTFGADVYYLPYFLGRPNAEEAHILYGVLHTVVTDTKNMTTVEQAYRKLRNDGVLKKHEHTLRFYVAAVQKHQTKRFDVFGDTLDAHILSPVELAEAHESVVSSWVFDPRESDALTPPLPRHENWPLTQGGKKHYLSMVASGEYFLRTFPTGDDDTDASADDHRLRALVAVLAGDAIEVETLLGQYVRRLVEGDWEGFPNFQVASQFAQLCALAQRDLLEPTDRTEAIAAKPDDDTTTMHDTTSPARADGGLTAGQRRGQKLERFIERTPALSGNTQRQGAFLLGALVGAVGSYQQWKEGRSTTLIDQFPIKSVSSNRIKRITQEAIDKTVTYTRQERRSTTKFEWIVNRLRDTIVLVDPDSDDWTLGTDDLRFYYALGVTYGMNDRRVRDETDDEDTDDEHPATTEEAQS